jgi:hypothetical protein
MIFDTLQSNREYLAKILKRTPEDVLSVVPQGFRNNIWWNIAHTLVVQQLLCYKLSGLPMYVDDQLVKGYSKGTFPGDLPDPASRQEVGQQLIRTADLLRKDYEDQKFSEYHEYSTSAGVTLSSIGDALHFNLYHEGLHMGIISSLLKVTR